MRITDDLFNLSDFIYGLVCTFYYIYGLICYFDDFRCSSRNKRNKCGCSICSSVGPMSLGGFMISFYVVVGCRTDVIDQIENIPNRIPDFPSLSILFIGLPAQYAYGLMSGISPARGSIELNRAFIPCNLACESYRSTQNLDRNSFPLYRNVLSSDVAKELFLCCMPYGM